MLQDLDFGKIEIEFRLRILLKLIFSTKRFAGKTRTCLIRYFDTDVERLNIRISIKHYRSGCIGSYVLISDQKA